MKLADRTLSVFFQFLSPVRLGINSLATSRCVLRLLYFRVDENEGRVSQLWVPAPPGRPVGRSSGDHVWRWADRGWSVCSEASLLLPAMETTAKREAYSGWGSPGDRSGINPFIITLVNTRRLRVTQNKNTFMIQPEKWTCIFFYKAILSMFLCEKMSLHTTIRNIWLTDWVLKPQGLSGVRWRKSEIRCTRKSRSFRLANRKVILFLVLMERGLGNTLLLSAFSTIVTYRERACERLCSVVWLWVRVCVCLPLSVGWWVDTSPPHGWRSRCNCWKQTFVPRRASWQMESRACSRCVRPNARPAWVWTILCSARSSPGHPDLWKIRHPKLKHQMGLNIEIFLHMRYVKSSPLTSWERRRSSGSCRVWGASGRRRSSRCLTVVSWRCWPAAPSVWRSHWCWGTWRRNARCPACWRGCSPGKPAWRSCLTAWCLSTGPPAKLQRESEWDMALQTRCPEEHFNITRTRFMPFVCHCVNRTKGKSSPSFPSRNE